MIKDIRDYIEAIIHQLDDRFFAHKQPNTNEGIGAVKFDRTYWLEIESLSTNYDGVQYVDEVICGLEVAIKGGRDPIRAHDELWCFAQRLRDRIVANHRAFFRSLEVSAINPEPIASQDNWTRLRLNISVTMGYNMRGAIT